MSTIFTKARLLLVLLLAFFCFATVEPAFAQDAEPAPVGEVEQKKTTQGFFDIIGSGGIVGWIIWILILGTSIAGVALIVDSFITVSEPKIISTHMVENVTESMEQGDVIKALNICNESPGPMANILSSAFENVEGGFEAVQDAVAISADLEAERLMQRVNYLNVVGNLSPMLGLLGTVQGMIAAFASLSGGQADPGVLALYISQALWTTMAGLFIAIPALAFFYYFRNKATNIILKMEGITIDQIKVLRHVEVVDDDE